MTIQKDLEANRATCANAECGKQTHYILVDPVDEPGMVFCSWACLWRYASKKDHEEFYREDCNDAFYTTVNWKAHWCYYQPEVFCQEGDCNGCYIYQKAKK